MTTSFRQRKIQTLKARANAAQTRAEKLADRMTAFFGGTLFLVGNAVWFVVWIVANAHVIPGFHVFDPFPFSMLTMAVSLEAIFLSIFVLIAQKRSERIDELRAEVDLQINTIAEAELTKVLQLVAKIAEKHGIAVAEDAELQDMIEPIDPEQLADLLEEQIAPSPKSSSSPD